MEKTRSSALVCPRCGHEYIPSPTNASLTTNASLNRPAARMDARPAYRQMESVSVEAQSGQASNGEFRPQTFNTEDLDIPTFLRNRR